MGWKDTHLINEIITATYPLLTLRLMQNLGSFAVLFEASPSMIFPKNYAIVTAWSQCSKHRLLSETHVGDDRLEGFQG